jgi:hypothetical protein
VITFTKISTSNPVLEEYENALKNKSYSREEAIEKATSLTGVKIHDIGNTSDQEMFYALKTLVGRKLNNYHPDEPNIMPENTSNLVIGHAGGTGSNWFFHGTNQRVPDYINKNIPQGEKAWVIACKTDDPKNFAKLEGSEVTSSGPTRNKIVFQRI